VKSIPLFRIDTLPTEQKRELVAHAEEQLAEACKPWRVWSEWQERMAAICTVLNIASLLDRQELLRKARERYKMLRLEEGL